MQTFTIGTRVRVVAPDPGTHGAVGVVTDVNPEWDHSVSVALYSANDSVHFRPDELEPVETVQSTITEPRIVRGTDLPVGREVASVVAVDPDGQGALIRLHIGEDLTVDAARELLAALTETLAEVAA